MFEILMQNLFSLNFRMKLSLLSISRRCFHSSAIFTKQQEQIMNVFDRRAKSLQRERAAISEKVEDFDYLKEEFGYRLADRVLDIKRDMKTCVDIGSGRGYVTKHLTKHSIQKLYCLEMSETYLEQCESPAEEEEIEGKLENELSIKIKFSV